jgi:hypothetical protein
MSIVSAKELQDILRQVQSDEKLPLLELAEGWLHWFKKRGDRYIKDSAKLGYSEVTLDLPIEIAESKDKKTLVLIQSELIKILDGCFVGFILDEYNQKEICKLLISWKNN